MAIDSAAKRGAALATGWPGFVLPFPDASIAAADRALLVGVYPFDALITDLGGGFPLYGLRQRVRRSAAWI